MSSEQSDGKCQTTQLAAQNPFAGAVFRTKEAKTGRVSSWDTTGGNIDYIEIKPGETRKLLQLDGPGILTHFYYTTLMPSDVLRSVVLRIYWDDETDPSVETPLADFFCSWQTSSRLFSSYYVTANQGSTSVGHSAYFPMPFHKKARVVLWNSAESAAGPFWYHIEYERYDQDLPADTAYFHAQWRRENPTVTKKDGPEAVPADLLNKTDSNRLCNVTGNENYVILEAEGKGQAIGLFLTCNNLGGKWWGEGDDMIFIDDDTWPPSYHGTGTEEIFGGGACPNQEYANLYTGFLAIQEQGAVTWRGQNSMYRWFVHDPIRFQKKIRWTIEHGHGNNYENDYSSVAYWYQIEPHATFPQLPDMSAC
jgi:hypothetical protein